MLIENQNLHLEYHLGFKFLSFKKSVNKEKLQFFVI